LRAVARTLGLEIAPDREPREATASLYWQGPLDKTPKVLLGRAERIRADQRLAELGLVSSRAKARSSILAGHVFWRGRKLEKPGDRVSPDAEFELRAGPEFVSRGGDKLLGALRCLDLDVSGWVCVDVGASTGGFTDCLLQRGAQLVYAVDVGRGQLAPKLRTDPRVIVCEQTDARRLDRSIFARQIDLVVVDASFISLSKLFPGIFGWLPPGGKLLALAKPQFEAGRAAARHGRGVIRDPEVRQRAILDVERCLTTSGFQLLGGCDSSLAGPKGNLERFVLASKREAFHPAAATIQRTRPGR
jgi:23S rRNA (cytidine1920-2'-O)/16S rRNA (cytidine1409-2'-O)-methyltransferase